MFWVDREYQNNCDDFDDSSLLLLSHPPQILSKFKYFDILEIYPFVFCVPVIIFENSIAELIENWVFLCQSFFSFSENRETKIFLFKFEAFVRWLPSGFSSLIIITNENLIFVLSYFLIWIYDDKLNINRQLYN